MPTAMFYGADSRPFIRHVGELSEDSLRERVATLKQPRWQRPAWPLAQSRTVKVVALLIRQTGDRR